MPEAWELTEAERDALPAWARRGVMPHRPEPGLHGEMQCAECCELWRDLGCEVVALTRHLAQTAMALVMTERDAAALREEKLIELALHAEEVAILRQRVAALERAG